MMWGGISNKATSPCQYPYAYPAASNHTQQVPIMRSNIQQHPTSYHVCPTPGRLLCSHMLYLLHHLPLSLWCTADLGSSSIRHLWQQPEHPIVSNNIRESNIVKQQCSSTTNSPSNNMQHATSSNIQHAYATSKTGMGASNNIQQHPATCLLGPALDQGVLLCPHLLYPAVPSSATLLQQMVGSAATCNTKQHPNTRATSKAS